MFYLQTALSGLAAGCIIALAGMGVVLTYKATGVFNFAHGTVGVLVAYLVFQFNTEWGVPIGMAAPLGIFVIAPLIGLALERVVFRPLKHASTTEKLVATLGVFVLMFGIVLTVWGGQSRVGPYLVSPKGFDIGSSLRFGYADLANVMIVAIVSGGLWAMFRFTHLGTEIKAVVDRPALAELASINANRIAGISWAMGATTAALAGVIFAGGQLDPLRLTLVLLDSFAVAVIARLTSLPLAVGAGIVLLGMGKALLGQLVVDLDLTGLAGQTFAKIVPNLGVVLLFVAVLVYRRLDSVGEATVERAIRPRMGEQDQRRHRVTFTVLAGVGLILLPVFLDSNGFDAAHRFLAMSVIFVSIVVVTGFSGQITLGQAGFAGLGAFASARFANYVGLPVLLAMVGGGLVACAAGFLAGYPALRRRGLFLALTTLSFGLVLYELVLNNEFLAGDVRGLDVRRPSVLWWSLEGPLAFYYYELVIVALMFLLARNLRSGPLGRALAAMRDSEEGARSVGLDLRRYKVVVFAASSGIAGIGGALLTQQAENFNPLQFFPINSLFWFAVVVVAGVGSLTGALLAGFIFVMLDQVFNVAGLSQLAVGFGALALGRLPGGNLVGMFRVGFESWQHAGRTALAAASRDDEPRPKYRLSHRGRELLDSPPPSRLRPPADTGVS